MLRRASKMPTLTYNCDLEKTAYEHALKCDQMGTTSRDHLTENSHSFTTTTKALTEAATEVSYLTGKFPKFEAKMWCSFEN
ncbi:hypothetical protein OESDEN_01551 [Oesophagostomum dentatum]|uniref:SCP domain-containing protein n=1 Tax=Oesophagostomum dentatum TaxID=61180 RepID=A0A0B1TRJ0_OESDE|nr:hypothetical protein OESDEN_01551 [Oesophagostomum dentatum]